MAKQDALILSHWHHLLENFSESSQSFYSKLEQAINKRKIPDVKISRIDYREGGIFSAKREYLRIKRKELRFDICAAPFGNGFFVSWWLGEKMSSFMSFFLVVPVLGPWLIKTFQPATYYKKDTMLMYQELVHSGVLEILDCITKDKGLRALTELERKPILKSLISQ
jgi:hypothetical protein